MPDTMVWLIWLEDTADIFFGTELGASVLTQNDREHITRLTDKRRKRSATATRAAVRLALHEHVGHYPSRQPISIGPKGKPMLPMGSGAFSISHTQRLALVAVSSVAQIGVDLETTRELTFAPERRERILAAAAVVGVGELADDDHGMLQGWTRLEAVAKARGTGIGTLLAELGIWGSEAGVAPPGEIGSRMEAIMSGENLSAIDLDLPPELFGSLAHTPASKSEIQFERISAPELTRRAEALVARS